MSDKCNHCVKKIEDSQQKLKCTSCEHCYHADCVGLKSEAAVKNALKTAWKCNTCKMSLRSGSTSGMSEESLTKILHELKREILDRMEKQFEGLQTSNNFLSEQINDMAKKIESSNAIVKEQQKQISKLEEENKSFKFEIDCLSNEINELQQYSRIMNVEISGIPETENEQIMTVVSDVAKCIGVQTTPGDVLIAHRVPTKSTKRPKPIIVQLKSRVERSKWLEAFKGKRNLTCNDINSSLPKNSFYVNEHLTARNKSLLYEAKNFAREYSYDFTWVTNGKIFIRKSKGSPAKRIFSLNDLDRLERSESRDTRVDSGRGKH